MEFYKLRHRKMSLMIGIMISFQFLFMMWGTRSMNSHELQQGWKSCLYSFLQINCIIMPLFIAMIASRLSDVEHKGNTFKLLKTIASSEKLFNAKVLCGIIYLSIIVSLQVSIMLVVNHIREFSEAVQMGHLIYYAFTTLVINLVLFIMQLILSLLLTNQMTAFIIAIGGTFLGLYSMLLSEKVTQWIIWGYYALLAPVRMEWDSVKGVAEFYWIPFPIREVIILIAVLIGFYIMGIKLFARKEC